jgi:CubicO group peptidase (beta-lactamase class C family)
MLEAPAGAGAVAISPLVRRALPSTSAQVEEYIANRSTLGIQIEVAHVTGARMRLSAAHPDLGYRLTDDTTFRWFCAIKSVLAMTVLTLLRANGPSTNATGVMDVPVAELLPEFAGGGRDVITIRHLLKHTSGLPSFPVTAGAESLDGAALATSLPAGALPGTATSYNICTAWTLISLIIEKLSGVPVTEAIARTVFEPLGLRAVLRVRSPADRDLVARVGRLVNPDQGQKRFAVLSSPGALAGLPAWIGGLGTLRDLVDVFGYFLRVRLGDGSRLQRETVLDVTARSAGSVHDATLGRSVSYAAGTMVDISGAGFGRGWSEQSFGVGGSVDKKVVIAAWADPAREVACGVSLPGVSQLNSTQLFRLGERIRSDVDAGAFTTELAEVTSP